MTLDRRRFLQLGGGVAAAWATSPWWMEAGLAATTAAPSPGRRLLILNLSGGNDGLNTVIPYGYGEYHTNRPTIGYAESQVLPLPGSSTIGLHPNLANVHDMYRRGRVAIIQGVGYDHPDLSHFSSSDIWESGSPTHAFGTGWIGRWLDQSKSADPLRAVAIGNWVPLALVGEHDQGVAIPSLEGFQFGDGPDGGAKSDARHRHDDFVRSAAVTLDGDAATAYLDSIRHTVTAVRDVNALGSAATPPPATYTDQVALAMTLLSSPLGVRVAMVEIDGFDDHAGEEANHPKLLKQVDDAIGAFADLAAKQPNAGDYLLMTFSEFGRRLSENGSGGTDHGTAAPLFVVGAHALGGLYGSQPSMKSTQLDDDGDLVRTVDFREVYATILDDWLGGASSRDILGYSSADGLHPIKFIR